MTLGIFPSVGDGGVAVRDSGGNPINPAGVENVSAPPASFAIINGAMRLFGSNPGTNLVRPSLLNAIISEIVALAAAMDPTGTWDAQGSGNLAAAFVRWRDGLSSETDPRVRQYFFARTSIDWNETIRASLNGSPYNHTGATLRMVIANAQTRATVRTLTIGSGLTVTDAANGQVAIHVAQSTMVTLPPGVYLHEMTVIHGGGLVDEVFNGTLTVLQGLI